MTISRVSGISTPFGNTALQITNVGDPTPNLYDGVKYPISLLANTSYYLSFYAKLASGSPAFSSLMLGTSLDGATNTPCSYNGFVSTATLSTGYWYRVTCTFTATTVSGSTYIFVGQNDTTAGRTWYLTGATLTDTTSSSSEYTGSNIGFYTEGTLNLSGLALSNTLIQPSTESDAAFIVAAPNGNVGLQVDTVNGNLDTNYVLQLSNRAIVTTTSTTALEVRNSTTDGQLLDANTNANNTSNLDKNGGFEYNTSNPPELYTAYNGSTITVDNSTTNGAFNAYDGFNSGKVVTAASANSGISYNLTTSSFRQEHIPLLFMLKYLADLLRHLRPDQITEQLHLLVL